MAIFKKFLEDRSGVHAIAMAVALLPVLGAAGLVIDGASAYMAEADLRASADAAALAAARSFADPDRREVAEAVFFRSLDTNDVTITSLDIQFDDNNNEVTVGVRGTTDNALADLFGIDSFAIDLQSTASTNLQEPYLDLVMCIDSTGSMWNTLAAAKSNALELERNLLARLDDQGIEIMGMRARAIYFRDFNPPDLPFPISGSPFFSLPGERFALKAFIDPQIATGGADWPEAGLECFHEAMNSAWAAPPNNRAVIIPIVAAWTDAPSDMPDDSTNRTQGGSLYPPGMPDSFPGLYANWMDENVIPQEYKTMVLFGPETGGWWGLRSFPGYVHGGSVTDANQNFVATLADAIVDRLSVAPPRLVN